MSRPVLLSNARIVDPASGRDEPGWLYVADGRVADIGGGAPGPQDADRVDAGGAVLAPALVDLSVEARLAGSGDRESVESASRAALAGGVTTMVVRPSGGAAFDRPDRIAAVASRTLPAHGVAAAGATADLAGERLAPIGLLAEAGARVLTTGARPIADARVALSVFTMAAHVGLPVAVRPQEATLAGAGVAHEGAFAGRLGLPGVPALAETLALERDARLAAAAGAQLWFDQLSSHEGVEALAQAKARAPGLAATVSAAHLAFNELDVGAFDPRFRLDPPLRAEADRVALIEGLREGTIDAVVSGHTACTGEDKRAPFPDAAPGGAGLETLLAATLALSRDYGFTLADALAPLTVRPADMLGLPQGRLAVGAPADLILFDPDTPWRCRSGALRSRTKVTPFDGRLLQGRVRLTMVAGDILFQDPAAPAPTAPLERL